MGMGGGRGMGMGGGRGMGGGGGMGMGGGRGMGRGGGRSTGAVQDPVDVRYSREEPNVQDLKAKAQDLARQMEEVREMISKLEDSK